MDPRAARTELEQLLREIDAASAILEGADGDESDELTQQKADLASEVSDNDRESAVLDAADARRAELVSALARVEDGSYGACVDCGQPIDAARLEFRPEAARCLADQERFEAAS